MKRDMTDRMIAGVCSGLAKHLAIDTTIVRAAFLISVLIGFGMPILAYIAMWILMPKDKES